MEKPQRTKKETPKKVISVIDENQKKALTVLLQGIEIAQGKGAFNLDDAFILKQSKDILKVLLK